MTGASFAVVSGSAAGAAAAASAALNASTSASASASHQHFWRAVANDPHLGPVTAVVLFAVLVAVVVMLLHAVITLWTTQ